MKNQLALALQLGMEFIGSMLAGLFLGHLAEQQLGTSSTWSMGLGAFVGLFVWLFRAVQLQKRLSQRAQDKK